MYCRNSLFNVITPIEDMDANSSEDSNNDGDDIDDDNHDVVEAVLENAEESENLAIQERDITAQHAQLADAAVVAAQDLVEELSGGRQIVENLIARSPRPTSRHGSRSPSVHRPPSRHGSQSHQPSTSRARREKRATKKNMIREDMNVWAKQTKYQYLPAKITKIRGTKYFARFYGYGNKESVVFISNIKLFSKYSVTTMINNQKDPELREELINAIAAMRREEESTEKVY